VRKSHEVPHLPEDVLELNAHWDRYEYQKLGDCRHAPQGKPPNWSLKDRFLVFGAPAIEEAEEKKLAKKHLWLELGAVSFRLCTHNYDCGSCAFAQDIQDRFGTISVIGEEEVAKFKELPGSQRLCRYASVHFVPKDKATT